MTEIYTNIDCVLENLENGIPTTSIVLVGQNLTHKHAEQLADRLAQNKHIREINLAHNLIGPLGAKAIARIITENPHIEQINIEHNLINNEGFKTITDAVERNFSLLKCKLAEIHPSNLIKLCQDRVAEYIHRNCMAKLEKEKYSFHNNTKLSAA